MNTPSGSSPASREAAERRIGAPTSRRLLRRFWPLLMLVLAIALVWTMSGRLTRVPYPSTELVLFGITGRTWDVLLVTAGLVMITIGIPALSYQLTILARLRSAWRETITVLIAAAICLPWVFIGPFLLFMLGASYEETRTIGTVDGHELVVRQHAPLNIETEVQAGFRTGLFVTFDATGGTDAASPTTPISGWSFKVTVHRQTVTVHYSGADSGNLILPRP